MDRPQQQRNLREHIGARLPGHQRGWDCEWLDQYSGIISLRYGGLSSPCQIFNYGEVEDYGLNIHCNLVTSTSDSGVGSLPWAVGCASAGETVLFSSSLNGQTINLQSNSIVVSKSLTIQTNPANQVWVHGASTQRVFQINPGVDVTISGLHLIAGTATEGGAIQNAGTLHLQNVEILRHSGLPNARPISNTGMLMIEGACILE
jgi:hypothetical protein